MFSCTEACFRKQWSSDKWRDSALTLTVSVCHWLLQSSTALDCSPSFVTLVSHFNHPVYLQHFDVNNINFTQFIQNFKTLLLLWCFWIISQSVGAFFKPGFLVLIPTDLLPFSERLSYYYILLFCVCQTELFPTSERILCHSNHAAYNWIYA